jgi:gamma-aminobutyric acid type B receptor
MLRVWSIFNKPLGIKSSFFQDYVMVLFVLGLVVIDFVILITYLGVEGLRENLGVERVANREFRGETLGPTAEVREYSVYVCISDGKVVLYAILYGYKGFLQVFALLLAFSTRKVKVKGLDDSKYIAAAIYVTSIVLAVTIVSTYTLIDYINVYPAVVGIGFLLGTTMILVLVFVPRMVGLYKDPHGNKITFLSTPLPRSIGDNEMRELRRRVVELENSLKRRRSSVPFSPNLDKLPPEVVNDRDVGESKVGFELDLARAPNSQQTGDQLANSTDNKTI